MGVATSALNKSMRARMEIEKGKKKSVDEQRRRSVCSVHMDTRACIRALAYGRFVCHSAETAKRAVGIGHIAQNQHCVTDGERLYLSKAFFSVHCHSKCMWSKILAYATYHDIIS